MILIADSGSTKCHWAFLDQKKSVTNFFDTVGLNPYFFSEKEILEELNKSNLKNISSDVKEVFFYSRGFHMVFTDSWRFPGSVSCARDNMCLTVSLKKTCFSPFCAQSS